MTLRLTMAFSDNPRVQPLKDGAVKPQNIDLECLTLDPSALFQRNLAYDEFDVSEMAIDDVVHIRDLKLPPNVKALQDEDLVVAQVREVKEEVVAPAAVEAEAAEPEVIGKKPEEGEEAAAAEGEEKK